MATMHPPRFPYPRDPKKRAEGQFYRACEEQLGDEWTVMYEQRWHGLRNGRNQRGEADFLMFSPTAGAFVVEVKGGEVIGVENGNWYTVPHGRAIREKIKNPFTQAADSKSVLWDFLREHLPELRLKGELGHMVVFPGHVQHGDMSIQARRQLICDRHDMKNLAETMSRVSRYSGQTIRWTRTDIKRIAEKLMPSFVLLGSRRPDLDEFFDQLNMLTEMQLTAFSMLRNHERLNIHGGAGTGKTVLAFHRAIELSLEGKRVVYLCHSTPLARSLRQELTERSGAIEERLRVQSVSEFAEQFLEQLMNRAEGVDYWDVITESCLEISMASENLIDALIIDEAQSIPKEAAESLRLLLVDSGNLYIFGDINQSTIRTGEQLPSKWYGQDVGASTETKESALYALGRSNPIELNVNCRSSQQIARYAHSIVQAPTETLGSEFADVRVETCPPYLFNERIVEVVNEWIDVYGLDFSDVRVLYSGRLPMDFARWGDQALGALGAHIADAFVIDWIDYSNEGHASLLNDYSDARSKWQRFFDEVGTSDLSEAELWSAYMEWVSREVWEKPFEEPFEEPSDDELDAMQVEFHARLQREFESRRKQLESHSLPIVTCTEYVDFIGLEARAVIVVLPLASNSEDRMAIEAFGSKVYTMATRARALLAVIGEQTSIERLDQIFNNPLPKNSPWPR